MSDATRIELCGRLRVQWRGEPIEDGLRGRQGRLLFAYLVLNRARPLRRDELVNAVWFEEAPPGVEAHLAPLLSRLRRLVGPDALEGRGDLTFSLPEGAYVDLEAAHHDYARAREHLAAERWGEAAEAAGAALEVAGRGLLPGLEAPWIEERRSTLADLRAEAFEVAARAGLGQGGGALAGAQAAARAAVEAAARRAAAHTSLLDILRARGNLAEALQAYEELRVLLRDELGTRPGPGLVALHAQILAEADSAAGTAPKAPAPVSATAAPAPPPADLVERERELAELAAVLSDDDPTGRLAVIEGPAGVGKTRLLSEVRRRAEERGTLVLAGRAGQFEQEFPFGVIRQLFEGQLAEPARRERLLSGAAVPAAAVFGLGTAGAEHADSSFAVLHGLFWFTVNLAGEQPVLLTVDDLHWCDRPSLRAIAYLVRRLEGLELRIAATLRTGEASADPVLLEEMLGDPATVSVRPGPLSVEAATTVVRDRLGADADPDFCAACHAVTHGNPLLLRQLLAGLKDDGVRPDAANTPVVREIGPRAVSRTIGLRLARMSADTVTVARAIAVLGEGAELPVVSAFAGLGLEETAAAMSALVRGEVLRDAPPLDFVHPLVRDAVYSQLPAGQRELHHLRAARALADARAPDDQVAVHLLSAPRRGDPWVVDALLGAGRLAAWARGATEAAVGYLRRALAEPPSADRRPALLLELGRAEQSVDAVAAFGHLTEAYDALPDPAQRLEAALERAWTMFFVGDPHETVAFVMDVAAGLGPESADERRALEAIEYVVRMVWGVGSEANDRLRHLREEPIPESGPGAKMLAAFVGLDWMIDTGPREACLALAAQALEGTTLVSRDNGLFIPGATQVFACADHPDALRVWDPALAQAHRRGSLSLTLTVHLWRGYALLKRGDVIDAERSLEAGKEELELWGTGSRVNAYHIAFVAQSKLERGDVAAARAALEEAEVAGASDPGRFVGLVWTEILLAEGRVAGAFDAVDAVGRSARPEVNPAWLPWRGLKARCLAALGRSEEALPLVEEELALARRWGAPASIGRALRMLALVEPESAISHLREAAAVLERSCSRLERAKANVDLGAALLAEDDPEAAHGPLEHGAGLAEVCGADGLAGRARELLMAAGAPEEVPPLSGVIALTDDERRVAYLLSQRRDERTIAQMLYLTPHEAEARIATALRKLGTAEPQELSRALAAAPA